MSLKITVESKNYYLKIPVRVRMYARMFARAYDCQDTTGHGTPPEHQHRKREEHKKSIQTKFVIVGRSKRQK